ncbi:MAG: poly(ADP-ribose) polymerase family protein [Isosphaeraceae bacterium]
MTILGKLRGRNLITRDYERPSGEATRRYGCQPEEKALAMTLAPHSEGRQLFHGVPFSGPETTYKSGFDEDILIVEGPAAAAPFKQVSHDRRRKRPKRSLRRPRFLGIDVKRAFGLAQPGARRTPYRPKTSVTVQCYDGVVETVHEGLAYLTLEARNGRRFQIEWDAAELARSGIRERQPFALKTITQGNRLEYEFIPGQLRPLPGRLRNEIDALRDYYRATGEFDDDDD